MRKIVFILTLIIVSCNSENNGNTTLESALVAKTKTSDTAAAEL